MIILDLETNGLMPECDTIHCAVAYDTVSGNVTHFIPKMWYNHQVLDDPLSIPDNCQFITDLPAFLSDQKAICCHNGIGFDLKVLKKVLNYEYRGQYVDTLMLARILFPDMEGGHSVEAWGERFGHPKVKHEDWSKFSLEMLHRCVEDVKIQAQIYEYCIEHMKDLTNRDSRFANRWQGISDLEHAVWRLMEEQADCGWEFDLQNAYQFCDELSQLCTQTEDTLAPILPPRVIQLTKTESGATKCFKANGDYTQSVLNWADKIPASGDFCRVEFEPFNIGSSQQVKAYLLKHGWEPLEYNFKKDKHNKAIRGEDGKYIQTSPKSPKTAEEWDEIAQQLNNPDIALLATYNKASHRLSQIKGLINATRSDHRIEAGANTCATNTARMAHRTVVNIPKADPKVYYGRQLRSLFKASPGKILVGCDASALEARCEAHYIYQYDQAAALLLTDGDIHTANAEAFKCDRNTAKTLKYAILYGCGVNKVASILKVSVGEAKRRLEDYWDVNMACKLLKERLEEEYEQHGYILAIDGRPLTIRYKHALLNTLLQSCGAICMKKATLLFNTHCKRLGFEMNMVGNMHDEIQSECTDTIYEGELQYGDMVGRICVNSIRQAGKDFNLNVPLDAEYKLGYNWSFTH